MTPDAITLLFKEARDLFPPFQGKPNDNNLLLIWETLLPILMEIPYNQLVGVHYLMTVIMDAVMYAAKHVGQPFSQPTCFSL